MATPEESLAELREKASREVLEMFHGNQDEAERWLKKPVLGLGYKTPAECFETREGIDRVRTLIARLEHGIII
jgi:putative toxin-antitoxin system antitoxin component (TIGR02293 family)